MLLLVFASPCFGNEGLKIILKDGSVEYATTGLAIEDNMLLFKNKDGNIIKMSKLMVDWRATQRVSPQVYKMAAPEQMTGQASARSAPKDRGRRDIVIDNKKLEALEDDTGLIQDAIFIDVTSSKQLSRGDIGIRTISNGEKVKLETYLIPNAFTIFDFYADWCGPCRILTPELEAFVKDHPTLVGMRKIDIKNFKTPVAEQYQIEAIPYLYVFDDKGKLFHKGNGFEALEKLKKHAESNKW
jgi:thioredoxin 1